MKTAQSGTLNLQVPDCAELFMALSAAAYPAENEQYDEIDRLEEEVQLDSYNSYLRSMQEEYDDGE